jgi:FAD/FMN-containing dehydrogenase
MSQNKVGISRRLLLGRLGIVLQGIFASVVVSPFRLLAQPLKLNIDAFKELISGVVIAKTDANYELTRVSSVWQQIKPKQKPALIIQAKSVNDVIEVVKYARANNKKISIRCGGHSYYASFLQDDMLMLDLSLLREFSIDKENRVAKVRPAMRAVDFMAEIAKSGFSFPAAHCGNVPMGGFLLGGGLGWNGEAWGGMSCFNIREVEVVTADGKLIRANEKQNEDYYWAARGGGPNLFGVITEFVLDLYPNPAVILTTTLIWDISHASTVASWLEETVRSMPVHVEALFILTENPDQESSADVDRVCIAQVSTFSDTQATARKALGPLTRDIPEDCLAKDEFTPTPIADLYHWDATAYPQWRWDVDSCWSDDGSGDIVNKLVTHIRDMPSPKSSILLLLKPHTKNLPDAAFSMIGSVYLACYAIWGRPEEDDINRKWVIKTMELLRPHMKGHYINESNYVDIHARRMNSFSTTAWEKLKRLSSKYDPDNLFHSYLE